MRHQLATTARTIVAWFDWAPDWLVSLGVLLTALLIAYALYYVVLGALHRVVRGRDLFWRSLVARAGPVRA